MFQPRGGSISVVGKGICACRVCNILWDELYEMYDIGNGEPGLVVEAQDWEAGKLGSILSSAATSL